MDPHADILGCWELSDNVPPVDTDTRVQMEFHPGGELTYGILQHGEWQVTLMTYRVDGATLLTSDESNPGEPSIASAFEIGSHGSLRLEFGGTLSNFEQVAALSSVIQNHLEAR